ncbi:hypothetical protein AMC99_00555 [Altererythrobacter epoxidivorans]|uniref:Uncharacterized protein n=1 Tax=Altererythrobacter epoxidivorans TaxID=361183 RepID=A0A0M4M2Y5_9SPHN|nr:hypothetical protein [Altererythrobacter epoxidivorans]ALE15865.1 hypothetical protein AMC99_00555 [Altererythrobacter epoxidivorans]
MHIDDRIAALQGSPALQRRCADAADTAIARWREENQAVLLDLQKFAQGAALEELPNLAWTVSDPRVASSFVDRWVSVFCTLLREEMLAQVPFRHSQSDKLVTMQIATTDGASLSLLGYEAMEAAHSAPTAMFVDREIHEIVIAGKGQARRVSIENQQIIQTCEPLVAGSMIKLRGSKSTRQIEGVEGRLVILQLSRVPERPDLSFTVDIASGRVLRRACGNKSASRQEMALAVLGAMNRSDAAATIARLAASDAADHLRWEAVRHALALDPVQGFAALHEIGNSPHERLAGPAKNLTDSLVAAHPQLARMETAPCPA